MWWSRFRFRDRRVNILLIAALIGLMVALLSDKSGGFGGDSWIIWVIIFAAIPAISGRRERRYRNRWRRYDEDEVEEYEYEKPKHDFEKPKREPRYALGDDGEIVEVDDRQTPLHTQEDQDKTLYV